MGASSARGLRVFVVVLLCLSALAALYSLGVCLVDVGTLGFAIEYDAVVLLRALELAAFVVLAVAMAKGSLKLVGAGGTVLLIAQLVALGIAAMQIALLGALFEGAFYLERILTLAGSALLAVGAFSRKTKTACAVSLVLFWLLLITNTVYELGWLPEYIYMSDFTAETVVSCLVAVFRDLIAPLGLVLLSVWAVARDGLGGHGVFSGQAPLGRSQAGGLDGDALAAVTTQDMEHYAKLLDRGILSKEEFEIVRNRYLAS